MSAVLSSYQLEWSQRSKLREVLRRHPIVHLAAPRLRASALVAMAVGLGKVDLSRRLSFRLAGAPEIMLIGNVRNDRGESVAGNALRHGFHSDGSYREHPAEITMLYALEVPTRGGNTEFASLYRLYDELDEATRDAWSEFEVEHETQSKYFDGHPDRKSVHPLVRCHPDTGRRLVYASPAYARKVIGLPDAETQAILRRIAESCEPPDVVHRWRRNDLLVWDNRAVLHRATRHDTSESRHLWRISVCLDPLDRETIR